MEVSKAAVADATVLVLTGLSLLGAKILLKIARAGEEHLVLDFGDADE